MAMRSQPSAASRSSRSSAIRWSLCFTPWRLRPGPATSGRRAPVRRKDGRAGADDLDAGDRRPHLHLEHGGGGGAGVAREDEAAALAWAGVGRADVPGALLA